MKPPVTTSDTETGIDDFQLKRRHYVKKGENIHSAVDTKEEPPDKVTFDFVCYGSVLISQDTSI